MVLDVPVGVVIQELGHDGLDIVYPHLEGTASLRGVHPQEILELFISRGLGLMHVVHYPTSTHLKYPERDDLVWEPTRASARFIRHITSKRGLLLGISDSKSYHAVAWDGDKVYDPRGYTYDLSSRLFTPAEAYIVVKLM